MVYFFSKKHFLKDLLEDFVDIHCHILPGIDDGATHVQESIELIKALSNLGVKEFIATPHIMQDLYPNTYESIGNAFQLLLETLKETKYSEITINPAAEYMMDSHFEDLLELENLYPLKGKYVLVEMSYFQPPLNLEEVIFKIKTRGYIPVLAHPERYSYLHKNIDFHKRLKQLGCIFQLNLLSLSDYYGPGVNKMAKCLLDAHLIDFVGTDVHHKNHIKKLSNLVLSKKESLQIIPIIKNTIKTFSVM